MAGNCCVFWDNSNIYIPAQEVATTRDGATVGRDTRVQFDHLWDLARAGRTVSSGVCVGSLPPELQDLWKKLRATGVELELFERGEESGTEQAVDQALQVHMLRALVDQPPGVAVLLTGDGAGYKEGKGFHADLERMHKRGWGVEVLSWEHSCNERLKAWAKANGVFVALDSFYDSITYVKGIRPARKLGSKHRQVSMPRQV
jgi:hypothetical protein